MSPLIPIIDRWRETFNVELLLRAISIGAVANVVGAAERIEAQKYIAAELAGSDVCVVIMILAWSKKASCVWHGGIANEKTNLTIDTM